MITDKNYLLKNLGRNNNWYLLDSERLPIELAKLHELYPDFTTYYNDKQNLCFKGKLIPSVMLNGMTRPLNIGFSELEIEVEFPYNYPLVFPIVHDLNNTLEGIPHVNMDKTICYAHPTLSTLDFVTTHFGTDAIKATQTFFLKLDRFTRTGIWPDELPHGDFAYIFVFLGELRSKKRFTLNDICPCKRYGLMYKFCCFNKVNALRNRYFKEDNKIARNSLCLCGKKNKFKNCCEKSYLLDSNKLIRWFNENSDTHFKELKKKDLL